MENCILWSGFLMISDVCMFASFPNGWGMKVTMQWATKARQRRWGGGTCSDGSFKRGFRFRGPRWKERVCLGFTYIIIYIYTQKHLIYNNESNLREGNFEWFRFISHDDPHGSMALTGPLYSAPFLRDSRGFSIDTRGQWTRDITIQKCMKVFFAGKAWYSSWLFIYLI